MTDAEYEALYARIRPQLTEQFLATLVEAAKIDGNGSDWIATQEFVRNVFSMIGKDAPEMVPYAPYDTFAGEVTK